MIYDEIQFPIYVVGTEDVDLLDGLLVADGQVIDDKNMRGYNLGRRRLERPMKSI